MPKQPDMIRERPFWQAVSAPGPQVGPILAKAFPAVVTISVEGTKKVEPTALFQDPLFGCFYRIPQGQMVEHFSAVGSGVIVDSARGYTLTLTASLASQKPKIALEQAAPGEKTPALLFSGLTTEPMPKRDPNYGKVAGLYVQVVDPSSAAARVGIRAGDIMMSTDRVPVTQTSELGRVARGQYSGSFRW